MKIFTAFLLVAGVFVFTTGCPAALTPRETVQQLQNLRYPKQIAEAQPLCTDPGWSMLTRMTANSHDFLRTFSIGEIKANPHLTDVQLVRDTVEGKSVMWVRLVEKDGVWQLNNMFVRKFNGVEVNLWVRYIYRNPDVLKHRFEANASADAANNQTGLQKFNDATTAIGNVLDIILKLHELSDHGKN